ncbi:uncharacterized protein LOC133357982 [Lethenteron reissneri]|uniref:uncharacterized protein LOC133357982 n=1 Tax=Lethenteron reissneri TaxID=7753 RepID=UPI002AB77AF0|nr:uncharacterized protein LOC133357982 [Lethenteron reissneri]
MLILVRRFVVDPDNCTQNALEIYEGRADSGSSNSSGNSSGPLARVCSEHVGGAATPRTIIASSGSELTVSLLLMSSNATNLNISVAFSAFTAGVGCLADEFACTNGRCVSVTLLCAGVDFCGDDSNNAAPSCHVNASMGGSSSSSMAPLGSVGSTSPSSSLLLPVGVTLALLLLLLLLAGLLCRSSRGCVAARLCRCCCSGCVAGTASLCLAGPLCVARGRIRRRRSVRSARSGGVGGGGVVLPQRGLHTCRWRRMSSWLSGDVGFD